MTEEEKALKQHLEKGIKPKESVPVSHVGSVSDLMSDIDYSAISVEELPCSIFYPRGTVLLVGKVTTKQVQAYSLVDNNNMADIYEKMDNIFATCVKLKYPDGRYGTYLDLKLADRFYVIFLIRNFSFGEVAHLCNDAVCECGTPAKIEYTRENFKKFELTSLPDKIAKKFDFQKGCFVFKMKDGKVYNMGMPSIGLEKDFKVFIDDEYVKIINFNKKLNPLTMPKLNDNLMVFLKIGPSLLFYKNSITQDVIREKMKEFESIGSDDFTFLNLVIQKMEFGITKVAKFCGCGREVCTDFTFPNGASSLFVVQKELEDYLED